MSAAAQLEDTGLEVVQINDDPEYARRNTHRSDLSAQLVVGMRRMAHAFVEQPGAMLQQLVDLAVTLCGADSAGISVERDDATDEHFYHWVATSGKYTPFLDAVLPRHPSACGITLSRSCPQMFRVSQRFFDILGVTAPLVTDGLLLPWQVEGTRGTIFVMAHGRREAFDLEHCRVMEMLSDFAAMAVRHQRQHTLLVEQASSASAISMANKLAHRINNPLQSLTNTLFLAANGHHGEEAREVGEQALADLERLSALVKELLALPFRERS